MKMQLIFFLNTCAEQYEGPEVLECLEQIVIAHLPIPGKTARIKATKDAVREAFHVKDRKRPYWIQGAEWPMGKNSPMAYIGRKKIPDGVAYLFQDVDTGENRTVEQYY